jgi:hypothetical protein
LFVDVTVVGATNPRWSVVVSSGTHGIEGFLGSAVQVSCLRKLSLDELAQTNGQFIFIHSLNPYGFAHLRRVNEENVDLNRNFLLPGEVYNGATEGYVRLNGFLNPISRPRRFEFFGMAAFWKILCLGSSAFKQAVAGGQYNYTKGMFFGGQQSSRSFEIVRNHVVPSIQSRLVVHVDFHTGLGKYAMHKLFLVSEARPEELSRFRELFETQVEHLSIGPYDAKGNFGRYMVAATTAKGIQYYFLTAEFGTHPLIRVLRALRNENRTHFYTPEGSPESQLAKAELLECFCPESSSWRSSVLQQGLEIIQRAHRAASQLASTTERANA